MASLEYNILEKAFEKKGYIFHNIGRFQLNIFGVRTKNKVADSFDDWIGVAYINEKNDKICEAFRSTTDAGTYWLKNPMRKSGTALLVPNQYLRAYRFGYHRSCNSFSRMLLVLKTRNPILPSPKRILL